LVRRIVFAAECFLELDSGDDRVEWGEVVEWRKKDSNDTSIIASWLECTLFIETKRHTYVDSFGIGCSEED